MIAIFSLTAAGPDKTYMVRHDLSSVSVAVAGPHGHSGTGKKIYTSIITNFAWIRKWGTRCMCMNTY